ncbi:dimethylaniline monooxygenase [Rhodococcus ruber BKS 20-38]|uniref:Dimethylaniline monooxygenase n=1 Tax=Rhodococcus ruber BKS 20-38 TaxID=1278076 RepID=M2YQG1_9NOCA|nr:dimethylaniline monooxygenase [Rhodococcus ruber BKS 20-38]
MGGPDTITKFLEANREDAGLERIAPSPTHSAKLVEGPAGRAWIEGIFEFETRVARGRGVVRLVSTEGEWKAWTLLTSVTELKGHEETTGVRRPMGVHHGSHRSQTNWRDRRDEEIDVADGKPQVVILGAGQSGLTLAARLNQLGVSNVLLERNDRVGDSWRKRYRSLVLHDPVWANHLPYLPFPPTWPVFTPRDKMADWLETYSDVMELNVWTSTEFLSGSRDDDGRWTIRARRADGTIRDLRPAHFVIATGTSSLPWSPTVPGEEIFRGEVLHSSRVDDSIDAAGKRVVVVGASNSAHDIAHDLVEQGAEVTMVQRSRTYVMSSEHGLAVQLSGVYEEGGPATEDADLIAASYPLPVLFQLQLEGATPEINRRDADLLEALERTGFRTHQEGISVQELFHRRGGGYYLNVGASEAIIEGRIAVRQGVEIDHFTTHGVVYTDGSVQDADIVIYATGFRNMRETARQLLGDDVADACVPVWGVDDEGELSGVWRRSGYDGLWFMAGNLNLIRPNSLLLALQIKAVDEGIAPRRSNED